MRPENVKTFEDLERAALSDPEGNVGDVPEVWNTPEHYPSLVYDWGLSNLNLGERHRYDPHAVYDDALRLGRLVQAKFPNAKLTCDQYDFWSSPWGHETRSAPIAALHRAISMIECDEACLDREPQTEQTLRDLIAQARLDGMTEKEFLVEARMIFRCDPYLAAAFNVAVDRDDESWTWDSEALT